MGDFQLQISYFWKKIFRQEENLPTGYTLGGAAIYPCHDATVTPPYYAIVYFCVTSQSFLRHCSYRLGSPEVNFEEFLKKDFTGASSCTSDRTKALIGAWRFTGVGTYPANPAATGEIIWQWQTRIFMFKLHQLSRTWNEPRSFFLFGHCHFL